MTVEEGQPHRLRNSDALTKGKYQFFVCTHIDKGHIHNHIYYNSGL
ncbi:MAG: relaxase/mobilization nuclease domain-containing protein [Eubacteriales bacterium]